MKTLILTKNPLKFEGFDITNNLESNHGRANKSIGNERIFKKIGKF